MLREEGRRDEKMRGEKKGEKKEQKESRGKVFSTHSQY